MANPTGFVSLDQHKLHAQALRQGLHERLDEILVSDFPASSPESVLTLLQEVLEFLRAEINAADNDDTLSMYCFVLRIIGGWLVFFDNAGTEQTPRGLVQLLENLMPHLAPNATILLWPQADYNYSIRDLSQLIANATELLIPEKQRQPLLARFKGPLKLMSFPRIERDNILMHAVLGHEIGHPVAESYLAEEERSEDYQKALLEAAAFSQKYVKAKLGPDAAGTESLKLGTEVLKHLIELRKRALQEMLSDAVAICSFGPSALFALFEFLRTAGWDRPPMPTQFYPPSRRRLRYALQITDRLGYCTALSTAANQNTRAKPAALGAIGLIDHVRELAAQTKDQEEINRDELCAYAYAWVDASLKTATEFTLKQTKQVCYDAELMRKELPELIERLQHGIPPNEIGDPINAKGVDPRSAIAAAWAFKLSGFALPDGQRKPDPVKELGALQHLTLRAIEYIFMKRDYQKFFTPPAAA